MIDLLGNELKKRFAPLRVRQTDLESRLERLRKAREAEAERNAARLAVLGRELEELVAAGKESAAKRQEISNMENSFLRVAQEIQGIEGELSQLGKEMETIARNVLNDVYPQIQDLVMQKMVEALDTQESARGILDRFQKETGVVVNGIHRDGLRFLPYGRSKEIRRRIELAL